MRMHHRSLHLTRAHGRGTWATSTGHGMGQPHGPIWAWPGAGMHAYGQGLGHGMHRVLVRMLPMTSTHGPSKDKKDDSWEEDEEVFHLTWVQVVFVA